MLGFAAVSAGPIASAATFPPPAVVEPPIVTLPGGGYRVPPWPELITGYGYGVLPELEGEAHGVVIAAGSGAAMLRNPIAKAAGAVGVDGRGEAHLTLKAAASGACGVTGAATGTIVIKGHAVGRHDDDAAAVMAWLLAA